MPIETYRARKGSEVSTGAAVAAAVGGYTIEVRFLGGLSDGQKAAFKAAADRWTRAITGDLPDVIDDNGAVINNLVILAQGAPIDGTGTILGQAGPTLLRPRTAGAAAFLPAKGEMTFDSADLDFMEQQGRWRRHAGQPLERRRLRQRADDRVRQSNQEPAQPHDDRKPRGSGL
jgi:hypothetical protein